MQFKGLIVIGLLWAVLSSCEKHSWQNHQPADYDGEFLGEEITSKAQWSRRWDLEAVVFNDKLWIFGGYNPGTHGEDTYHEDVWNSENGKDWDLITESAPWKGRRGHKVVTFDAGSGEAIYLIGGFSVDEESGYRQYCNDVWRSVDGKNWEQIKKQTDPYFSSETDWYPRFEHRVVVSHSEGQSCLFLIGGSSLIVGKPANIAMHYFDDVWRSFDGVSWEKLSNNNFGLRSDHAAAVNPQTGEILIQGGWHGLYYDTDTVLGEPIKDYYWVWKSTDGINWVKDSINTDFSTGYFSRAHHEMVFYKGMLYGLPGKNPKRVSFDGAGQSSIWKRIDEKQYIVDSKGLPFFTRYGYGMAVWKDKIWIIGGYTVDEGRCNEVWTLEIED